MCTRDVCEGMCVKRCRELELLDYHSVTPFRSFHIYPRNTQASRTDLVETIIHCTSLIEIHPKPCAEMFVFDYPLKIMTIETNKDITGTHRLRISRVP